MLRSPDGRHHAKIARDEFAVARLAAERDRQLWLATAGVAAPVVVDWVVDDDGGSARLVSSTVPGVPASAVQGPDVTAAMGGIGTLLARLHAVEAPCPFDHRLEVTTRLARGAVAAGAVDVADLDASRAGRSASSLLTELEQRAAGRAQSVVLCHGDASLPNLCLDPRTWQPTGIVDVGRLGIADRYLDLALVVRSMDDPRNPGYGGAGRDAFWRAYGWDPEDADPDAIDFYQLLDEFF